MKKGDGKGYNFTNPNIQNKVLQIISLSCLRDKIDDIKSNGQNSIMREKTVDLFVHR